MGYHVFLLINNFLLFFFGSFVSFQFFFFIFKGGMGGTGLGLINIIYVY